MILLDTSALIRWICVPGQLSKRAGETIEKAIKKSEILISSISVWEICLLIKKNRVGFFVDPDTWLQKVESLPFVKFVPVDNRIAAKSVNLPDFPHKDPADRMIIATAREYGAILITSDKKILRYKHIQTLKS